MTDLRFKKSEYFFLFLYAVAAYFFWVERNYIVGNFLFLAILVISLAFSSFKQFRLLTFILFGAHFFNWGLKFVQFFAWPIDLFLLSVIGFLAMKYIFKQGYTPLKWSFNFSKTQWISVAIINVPSIVILYIYFYFHKDIANTLILPEVPLWSLPFMVLLIAIINGLREEIFFRGLIQGVSNDRFSLAMTLSLQAVLFGFLHYTNAFPAGWIGVVLTGIWGVAISIQYYYFKSISLVWVTHSIADAVMFTIILLSR